MAKQKKTNDTPPVDSTPIPAGQKLFDNMFLWLILSLLISGLLYNAWGLIEVFSAPGLTP
ncbi:MAG: hypothetical protein R3C14_14420 [Caldilineaceae bacterium]